MLRATSILNLSFFIISILFAALIQAEQLTIPNDSPTKVKSSVLEQGRWYRIEARGTISDWADKDEGVDAVWCYAEWRCGVNGIPWQQLRIDNQGMIDIAGQDIPYNSSHIYSVRLQGQGRPLSIWMWDAMSSSSNNSGSIQVSITPEGMASGSTGQQEEFSTIEEAMRWLKANHPYRKDGGHWMAAINDPRFDRFQRALYQKDPNSFYEFKDRVTRRHEFWPGQRDMERIPNSATKDYFCHDFAWRTGSSREQPVDPNHPLKKGKHIEPADAVKEPGKFGFRRIYFLANLRTSDIVVYFNDSWDNPSHSAVVLRMNPNGVQNEHDIYLMSKDVDNSLFRHRLGVPGKPDYFRQNFGSKGVRFYRRL